MMAATKQISLRAVLTIVTTKLWCENFGDFHEAAEFVVGHPVWTHEFADRALWDRMRDAVVSQHPEFADYDNDSWTGETFGDAYPSLVARHGEMVELRRGNAERTEHPIESCERIMNARDPRREGDGDGA